MRSRSARSFSGIPRALLIGAALWPSLAQATLTITSLQSAGRGGNEFWFAGKPGGGLDVTGAGPNSAFADTTDPDYDFRILDTSATSATDPGGVSNGITFRIHSDKPTIQPPAGASTIIAVMRVFVSNGTTTNSMYAPVMGAGTIEAGSSACDGSRCATLGTNLNRFYGAVFIPGQDLYVTFLPQEICATNSRTNTGSFEGCAGGALETGSIVQMYVKFSLIAVPDLRTAPPGVTDIHDAASLDDGPATTTLSFQTQGPAFDTGNCTNMAEAYEPGDGEILVETNTFSITLASTSHAPGSALIAVAKQSLTGGDFPAAYNADVADQATMTSLLTPGTGHEVVSRVAYQGGQLGMKGFTNTDGPPPTGSPAYQVVFLVRDAAGMVAAPVTSGSCALRNVRTADIQGFLSSGRCFIATAAFRDAEGGPVRTLRAFRDRVLLPSRAGRAFVGWYYAWSPGAAEWLMKNPEFRHPVLLALVPVQILAWLALHPAALAALAMMGLFVLVAGSWGLSRRGAR
ncbi:MAG TPA: CFI-box-CTERM domain-containing protein [Bdellovibrionota bacterium]|nr:CFI-box-CTERM domain-containing protein [Bdellovibrionota bacterium]